MLNIGSHLSISKGFYAIGRDALSIGANTFQFFTRNPRGGSARKIDIEDVNALIKLMTENNFAKILAHAPYTMNLCSAKTETREFALNTLTDDLKRMEYLPNNLYNFHPGSHTGQGVKAAVEQIGTALNTAMFDDMTTTVLLETMAGKGTEVGRNFEELRMIIDRVEMKDMSDTEDIPVLDMAKLGIAPEHYEAVEKAVKELERQGLAVRLIK